MVEPGPCPQLQLLPPPLPPQQASASSVAPNGPAQGTKAQPLTECSCGLRGPVGMVLLALMCSVTVHHGVDVPSTFQPLSSEG